jgi:hypothetical protein
VKVHIRPVSRHEIEHPATEVIGAEEIDLALSTCHFFVKIRNVHSASLYFVPNSSLVAHPWASVAGMIRRPRKHYDAVSAVSLAVPSYAPPLLDSQLDVPYVVKVPQ